MPSRFLLFCRTAVGRLLLTSLTLVLSGPWLPAQTQGPLRVHPENPRCFADRSGKAILLTGSHTWSNLVDMGPSDPPPAFDFDAYLNWLQEHGHNFTRGWTWKPTRWDNTRMKNIEWRNGAHTVASGMTVNADPVIGGAKRLLHPQFSGAAVLFLHCPPQP